MPFQKTVNLYNPLAVAGDFASANPRATALAGEGGFVAGPAGVTVAKFAWALPSSLADTNAQIVTNYAQGAVKPTGFVHREQQALITPYLAEYSNLVPQGFPVTLHTAGDFWAVANGAAAVVGSSIYASYADGSIYIGSAPAGASATGSIGATFTATGTGTSLAVSAVTGYLSVGDTLGTVSGVPAGTTIVAQVSGTAGGAGTYTTSVATTVAAGTVTSFGNVLDVTAVGSGTLAVGDAITGTGIPSGATIESFVSGVLGGAGLYTISTPATAYAASTTVTVVGGILTSFVAQSVAAVGELVKIHNWGN